MILSSSVKAQLQLLHTYRVPINSSTNLLIFDALISGSSFSSVSTAFYSSFLISSTFSSILTFDLELILDL